MIATIASVVFLAFTIALSIGLELLEEWLDRHD